MSSGQITLSVKVKRGSETLGKSKMCFAEGAYTPADLARLYAPVVSTRAVMGAVENGMRVADD